MAEFIRIETDTRGVATLWLARPDKHNALNAKLIAELDDAAAALAGDDQVRVVILRGEGRSFCAGGDLDWMRVQMAADRATRMAEARALAGMLGALNSLPKPLIGMAEGIAFGGGVGLLAVCDVALSVPDARFGLTETRLGLIPATIGPYVIARLGPKARSIFYSSTLFDAETAMALGLIHRVVDRADAAGAIEAEIAPYLGAAPGAVAAAKALAANLGLGVAPEAVAQSIEALADQWETEEAREGIAAFFDKRKASWSL